MTASQNPDSAMQLAGLGSLLTVIGAVLIGPVVARLATAVIGIPVRMFGGQSGKLARRNSMRNPRRTAGTASALMLGTAVVALFATFAASIKQSLDDLIANAYEGDLVVVQEGWGGVGLSRDLAPAIDALPEVETATGLTFANFTVDGETADEPFAIDPAAVDAVVDLDVVAGSLQTMDASGIAVSEAYADDKGWTLGSPVSVGFADGVVDELHVAAVYKDANILGDLMIDEDAWLPHTPRSDDFIVLISLADGVSVDQGRAAIDPLTAAIRCASVDGPRRVPRVGDRGHRPDARPRVRPARAGDPDRPARHRQHAVAQPVRADARARSAAGRRPDAPPAAPHRPLGERDHRRVRHDRRRRASARSSPGA